LAKVKIANGDEWVAYRLSGLAGREPIRLPTCVKNGWLQKTKNCPHLDTINIVEQ